MSWKKKFEKGWNENIKEGLSVFVRHTSDD